MSYLIEVRSVDSIIRELMSDLGEHYPHRYGEFLNIAYEAVRILDRDVINMAGIKYIFCPVSNGFAQIPGNIKTIEQVGIEVGGHFIPILEDSKMIFRQDDCGNAIADFARNPDIIRISSSDGFPNLISGGVSSIGGTKSFSQSLPSSINGYHRIWQQRGVIQLTEGFAFDYLVLECFVPSITPYAINYVYTDCTDFIKEYILHKVTKMSGYHSTKNRGMIAVSEKDMKVAKFKLRTQIGKISDSEFFAALRKAHRYGAKF